MNSNPEQRMIVRAYGVKRTATESGISRAGVTDDPATFLCNLRKNN